MHWLLQSVLKHDRVYSPACLSLCLQGAKPGEGGELPGHKVAVSGRVGGCRCLKVQPAGSKLP